MSNKVILLVVAAILLIITGVFYFLSLEDEGEPEDLLPEEEVIVTDFRDDAYLYKAGEDGEETGRDAGNPVDEFSQGDILGMIGHYTTGNEREAVVNFVGENGNLIEEKVMEFIIREGEDRDFDVCCAEVPEDAGSYYAEVVVDGESVLSVSFEVI